jgi:hypothetical protein
MQWRPRPTLGYAHTKFGNKYPGRNGKVASKNLVGPTGCAAHVPSYTLFIVIPLAGVVRITINYNKNSATVYGLNDRQVRRVQSVTHRKCTPLNAKCRSLQHSPHACFVVSNERHKANERVLGYCSSNHCETPIACSPLYCAVCV